MSARSIPNLLGVLRLILSPVLFAVILLGTIAGYGWACTLLLFMAFSDLADGKIARRLNAVSPLGVFLDTTSDKIFVAATLLPLIERSLLPAWVAGVIIVRDFAVSGLRSYASAEGHIIPSGRWGKQKLVITVVALIWRLVAAMIELWPAAPDLLHTFGGLWVVAIGLCVLWTIASGIEYFVGAWPMLRGDLTPRAAPHE